MTKFTVNFELSLKVNLSIEEKKLLKIYKFYNQDYKLDNLITGENLLFKTQQHHYTLNSSNPALICRLISF